MKSFLKYTLATICGLVIFTFIAGLIFFASLLGMAASGSSTTQVKDNSVFVLKMDGAVQERMEGDTPLSMLLNSSDMDVMGLEDIVASIKKAKDHNDIKGIYIEGGLTEFDSPASAQQVRDALKDFKKSGKWILAYADNYTQQGYYVASVADTVILNLTGMIELKGIGGKREYMTGLYEKLGVKYQPVRVGKYKSYVESVTRKDMSPENREQTEAYQQGIWKHMLKDMAESRSRLTAEQIDQMVSDSILTFASPADYLKGGLVDALRYPEEVKPTVNRLLGADLDDDINQLLLSDMIALPTTDEKGDEVAVYYAYGEIIDQKTSMFSTEHNIIGKETVDDLNKLADDDNVKAVVLRVNSPQEAGGGIDGRRGSLGRLHDQFQRRLHLCRTDHHHGQHRHFRTDSQLLRLSDRQTGSHFRWHKDQQLYRLRRELDIKQRQRAGVEVHADLR